MRIPSIYTRNDARSDSAMTPMIDVVFLLLIFFVWTASFQAIEALLPSELTASSSGGAAAALQEEDFERIVVRIRDDAATTRWSLNGRDISAWGELRSSLEQLASIRTDLPVVVDPDQQVPLGDVIDVYDAARQVGLANIQFTTRQ
jgi:biopolymer transport protein ExbD